MPTMISEKTAPLEHQSESEIELLLRGFPDMALSGAKALMTDASDEDLESCLLGVLYFYLPAGTKAPEARPSGGTRLGDELGLDSLSLAEAMFKVEELFNVRVENAELADIVTLSDACRLLMGKLEEARNAAVPDE